MKFWTPPPFPEGTIRTELHISGSEDTYLHDLIEEFAEPFDSWEEPDGLVLIYTSPEAAKDALSKLHDKLIELYPDEVFVDEEAVLYYKDCELFVLE